MGRLGVVHAFGDAHNTDSMHSARSWKRELSADFGTSIKHFLEHNAVEQKKRALLYVVMLKAGSPTIL